MDFMELIDYLSPVACLLLGAVIGYIVDVRKNYKKKYIDYNMTIFEEYKKTSTEIIETIIPLTSLSLRHRGFDPEQLEEMRKKISDLYFKYYTYLPQVVLNEINCLHSCVQSGGKNLYVVKNDVEIKICAEEDAESLLESTALISNEEIIRLIKIYPISRFSESLKINLQARRVIHTVAAIFRDKTINDWDTILRKETLIQIYSKKTSENKETDSLLK